MQSQLSNEKIILISNKLVRGEDKIKRFIQLLTGWQKTVLACFRRNCKAPWEAREVLFFTIPSLPGHLANSRNDPLGKEALAYRRCPYAFPKRLIEDLLLPLFCAYAQFADV